MSKGDFGPLKRLQWRLEYLAHCLLGCMAGILPGPWVFRLGEWLGELAWYWMPRRRRIVLRNLRICFAGELGGVEIGRLARANFRRSGANLLSLAHTARVPAGRLGEVFELANPELLERALAAGRGVVLLLAHTGNWELLSRIAGFFPPGTPTAAFYRPLANPWLDQQVLRRRQADGTRMISKGSDALRAAALLREGTVIGILADQRVGERGDLVPFFGRLTLASPLPSLLARRAKSPVLALSLVTVAPGRWRGEFLPVGPAADTAACMAAIERLVRGSPVDYFWLHDRWKSPLRRYRTPHDWLGTATSAPGKGHRAVLWLADAPETWHPGDEWLHPDVQYEVALGPGQPEPNWLPPGSRSHPAPMAGHAAWLRALDDEQPMPLDFLLAWRLPSMLEKAAECIDLRVITLEGSGSS